MSDNMHIEWMDYPNHMWGSYSGLGWLIPILVWSVVVVGIIILVYLIVKSERGSSPEQKSDPIEILNERYARGEIDEEEYEKRKKKLEGN